MRKRSGAIIFSAIIFSAIIIIVIVLYYLVPVVKVFIDANTALVTFLGVLIGIFIGWYSLQSEKKKIEKEIIGKEEIPEETLKKEIDAEILENNISWEPPLLPLRTIKRFPDVSLKDTVVLNGFISVIWLFS